MEVTLYFDGSRNLLMYSKNYLFDKKMYKFCHTENSKEIEEILNTLTKEEKGTVKRGWMIKTILPKIYEEIYFE